eukprot:90543-Alexandrium_andersonii.AAC.1
MLRRTREGESAATPLTHHTRQHLADPAALVHVLHVALVHPKPVDFARPVRVRGGLQVYLPTRSGETSAITSPPFSLSQEPWAIGFIEQRELPSRTPPRNFGFGSHAEVAPWGPWVHRIGATRRRQHAQKCICAGSPKFP